MPPNRYRVGYEKDSTLAAGTQENDGRWLEAVWFRAKRNTTLELPAEAPYPSDNAGVWTR